MPFFKLKKVITHTGEETIFGDAALEVITDGYHKNWEVELASVKNDKYYSNALREKQMPVLKFVTEEGHEFEGKVLVSRIQLGPLGTYITLHGTGPLNGYED
jgi:predicted N-acetyltransferase YhbS